MKTVIMAGGKGTRISSIAKDIPKPMIKIANKPLLEYQIDCLKRQGFNDIIIVIGYLGNVIREYFCDGQKYGVNITYFQEETPLGTAGALAYLKEILVEDFLLLNGDILFDVDFKLFLGFHKKQNALVTLFTHPNSHPYDSAIIETDANSKVIRWLNKEENREMYKNRVNAGLHIMSPIILNNIKKNVKTDLDRDLLKQLVDDGKIFAYDSPEYAKDMGTPERYEMVCNDFISGMVSKKNLSHKQKAIFLDRDGTINRYNGFITNPNDLELLDGTAEAIAKINDAGYLAIVITNQPVIARGDCSMEKLQEIHNKMEALIGEKGAYLDAIYFCPHHPDKGYEGENLEYKVECNCRKPKPGMIYEAAKKFNIDISESFMVGDSIRDVEAGKAAGCKTVLLGSINNNTISEDVMIYSNLFEFVNKEILQKEK